MNATDAAATAAADPQTTLLSMFWSAHIVVKIVMLGLLALLVLVLDDHRQQDAAVRAASARAMDSFEQVFWSGQSLEELYASLAAAAQFRRREPVRLGDARMEALVPESPPPRFAGLHARLDKVLDVSIAREVERLESNLLFLATVASAGPFVGLFGTVWGIMTAFRSIAASKNTSLAVVAPGIAEALLATAIGLFAAIPALIAYNKLQGDVARAQARMESFADEFSSILSRQIDQHLSGDTRGLTPDEV